MESKNEPLAVWKYSKEEWHRFVKVERRDLLLAHIIVGPELSLYAAIPFWIFSPFPIGIDFLIALGGTYLFLALNAPFKYGYLKKNVTNPTTIIHKDHILLNGKKFKLRNKIESLKSVHILVKKNNYEVLVCKMRNVKPPYTLFEFHVPIPKGQRLKALELINTLTKT